MLTALTRFEMLSCVQRQTPEHLSALQNLNQLVCGGGVQMGCEDGFRAPCDVYSVVDYVHSS